MAIVVISRLNGRIIPLVFLFPNALGLLLVVFAASGQTPLGNLLQKEDSIPREDPWWPKEENKRRKRKGLWHYILRWEHRPVWLYCQGPDPSRWQPFGCESSRALSPPVNQAPVNQSLVNQSLVSQSLVSQSPVNQSPVIQAHQSQVNQAHQSQVKQSPVNQSPVNQTPVNSHWSTRHQSLAIYLWLPVTSQYITSQWPFIQSTVILPQQFYPASISSHVSTVGNRRLTSQQNLGYEHSMA